MYILGTLFCVGILIFIGVCLVSAIFGIGDQLKYYGMQADRAKKYWENKEKKEQGDKNV